MNAKTTTPTCCPAHEPTHWVEAMIDLADAEYEKDVDLPSWDKWAAAFWEQYPEGTCVPFPQHVYYLDSSGAVVGVSPGVEREYAAFFVKEGTRYIVW